MQPFGNGIPQEQYVNEITYHPIQDSDRERRIRFLPTYHSSEHDVPKIQGRAVRQRG
jgi:hypothetical protein